MVLRLEGDGSLTTAIGAVRKLLFFDSDSRMAIGNSAGLALLGRPDFNRKDGREVGWKSCRVDNFTGLDGAPHLLRDESARSNARACVVDRAHEC